MQRHSAAARATKSRRIVAERRWFSGSPEQCDEFPRLLDDPSGSAEKLARLWSRPSLFDKPSVRKSR